MYPRTKTGAEKYRKKKRITEIGLIIKHIEQFIQSNKFEPCGLQVLEFGSGPGFQTPYLQRLGHVTASDVYVSDGMRKILSEVDFLQCNITYAPFEGGCFDLVFSNHAIEHIRNLDDAFREMKRIGKPGCIYAFAMPTSVWLLLSLPARYYLKAQQLFKLIFQAGKGIEESDHPDKPDLSDKLAIVRALDRLRPRGHGAIYNFSACYRAFKIDAWRSLFERNGFVVIEVHPLLLYAASEWPVVPTTDRFNRFNICSSVLFLMQKE
jgi:SAM-dependent methyltransferase